MSNLQQKIKLIYIPFLIINVAFIVIYSFLYWAIIIRYQIEIKSSFLKFCLPFILSIIPISIWLYPRLSLFKFQNQKDNFGLSIVCIFIFSFPTLFAQDYIITATGKLTKIEKVSQIENHEITKYYLFEKYFIDKENIVIRNSFKTLGKRNDQYQMSIDIAMPLLDEKYTNDDFP